MSDWFLWSRCVNDGVCVSFYREESSGQGHCRHLCESSLTVCDTGDEAQRLMNTCRHLMHGEKCVFVELTESCDQGGELVEMISVSLHMSVCMKLIDSEE